MVFNFVVANGQSCTIKYILNGRYRQSVGFFRLESARRRLESLPRVRVRWNAEELHTRVEYPMPVHSRTVDTKQENPGLLIVTIFACFLFVFGVAVMRRLKSMKKVKYVETPQEEPEEDMSKQFKKNINTMKRVHRKMRRERRQEWYKERHRKHYQHVLKDIVQYKRPTALDRVKRRLKLNGLKYIK